MKCLSQDKIAGLNGNVVHDSHAEILALRAFNRFLLDECADLAAKGRDCVPLESHVLQWTNSTPTSVSTIESLSDPCQGQPFSFKPNVRIHMYCSEAPCGDASMELTMAAQHDATPWTPPPHSSKPTTPSTASPSEFVSKDATAHSTDDLYGRSYFHALGVVRRKPSRPDAPPTLSKSCSDKLAIKQCTSLLSAITSMLIHPGNAYLHTLILPSTQHVPAACERAFSPEGRMALLVQTRSEHSNGGYAFRPFHVMPTKREFGYSRRIADTSTSISLVPSNLSTLAYGRAQETLINGVLQGRKQFDPKGASATSRRSMWGVAVNAARLLGGAYLLGAFDRGSYADLKRHDLLSARNAFKAEVRVGPLRGWKCNFGDDHWSL